MEFNSEDEDDIDSEYSSTSSDIDSEFYSSSEDNMGYTSEEDDYYFE